MQVSQLCACLNLPGCSIALRNQVPETTFPVCVVLGMQLHVFQFRSVLKCGNLLPVGAAMGAESVQEKKVALTQAKSGIDLGASSTIAMSGTDIHQSLKHPTHLLCDARD
eukprot:1207221-Rhodomonas_salina.1